MSNVVRMDYEGAKELAKSVIAQVQELKEEQQKTIAVAKQVAEESGLDSMITSIETIETSYKAYDALMDDMIASANTLYKEAEKIEELNAAR